MVTTLRAIETCELAPKELFRTFMMYLPIDQTSYTYLKNWPVEKPLDYWGLKTHREVFVRIQTSFGAIATARLIRSVASPIGHYETGCFIQVSQSRNEFLVPFTGALPRS